MPKKTPERIIDRPASNARRASSTTTGASTSSSSVPAHNHDGSAGSGGLLTEAAISDLDKYTQAQVDALLAALGIDDLSDVDTSTAAPSDGQALVWDTDHWAPGTVDVRWEPLTNGDAASPELVFADGDVVMVKADD